MIDRGSSAQLQHIAKHRQSKLALASPAPSQVDHLSKEIIFFAGVLETPHEPTYS